MKLQFKSKQRGVSLLGLAFVGGVLVCVGILGAQAFPTFTEYQAVLKGDREKAKAGSSVVEARTIFDKAAQVDDIKSISGKDLEVTKTVARPPSRLPTPRKSTWPARPTFC
jgi:hypothetical protein